MVSAQLSNPADFKIVKKRTHGDFRRIGVSSTSLARFGHWANRTAIHPCLDERLDNYIALVFGSNPSLRLRRPEGYPSYPMSP